MIPDLACLSAELDELDFPGDKRTRVPLPQYMVRVVGEAKRRDADLLYRAAGTVAGRQLTLVDVLELIQDRHGGQFGAELRSRRPLDAGAPAGTALLVWHLQAALEEAAVRSGAAWCWRSPGPSCG